MSDPFDPVSVHGVWPLVPDPSRPGGIRFASMATDRPEDCVTDVRQLPDTGLELRLFQTGQARDAWCEAVSEFGGNAVHASPLPEDSIPAALLVRFDRDRASGSSPEECIALVGTARGDTAHARHAARRTMAHDVKETAWRAAWAKELSEAEGIPGLRVDEHDHAMAHDRLILSVRGHRLVGAVWVERSGDRRRVTLRIGRREAMEMNHGDLDASLRESLSRLGYALSKNGDLTREAPGSGGALLAGVIDDIASIEATRAAVHERSMNRSVVSHLTDGRQGDILRRAAAGFPVCKAPASSGYAYQVNPVSGHGVDVPDYPLGVLIKAGTLRPAWWTERVPRPPKDKPLDAFAASAWVATDFGHAVAAGKIDVAEAADRLPEARRQVAEAMAALGTSPPIEALRDVVRTGAWSPPADAPQVRFPLPKSPGKLPKRAKDIAVLAAWLVNGLGPAATSEKAPAPKAAARGTATGRPTRGPR